jgi:hypothetical protein
MDIGFHAALGLLRLCDRHPKQADKADKVLDAVSIPLAKFVETAWKGQQAIGKVKDLTGIDLLADDRR